MSNSNWSGSLKVFVVLAPWSSGSTAVTGYLRRAGAWTCPPHQITNDPLTIDSHESKEFRDALCATFDELTLTPLRTDEGFNSFFANWIELQCARALSNRSSAIVLKHPLSAYLVPQISRLCDAEFIVVTRPIQQIERSRIRRGWHPVYGQQGAEKIYSTIFSNLIAIGKGFFSVSYPEFLSCRTERQRLIDSCNLFPTEGMISEAEGWLRSPKFKN